MAIAFLLFGGFDSRVNGVLNSSLGPGLERQIVGLGPSTGLGSLPALGAIPCGLGHRVARAAEVLLVSGAPR